MFLTYDTPVGVGAVPLVALGGQSKDPGESGPTGTVLSLSQKSGLVKEPGWVYLGGNFAIWDMNILKTQ